LTGPRDLGEEVARPELQVGVVDPRHGADVEQIASGSRQKRSVARAAQRVTVSVRPSVSTITAPSRSVRQRRAPAAAKRSSTPGSGRPYGLRGPPEMTAIARPTAPRNPGGCVLPDAR